MDVTDSYLDEENEVLPIPLDRETIKRLARLALTVGRHPIDCASSLLHHLMRDDEMMNVYDLTSANPKEAHDGQKTDCQAETCARSKRLN